MIYFDNGISFQTNYIISLLFVGILEQMKLFQSIKIHDIRNFRNSITKKFAYISKITILYGENKETKDIKREFLHLFTFM